MPAAALKQLPVLPALCQCVREAEIAVEFFPFSDPPLGVAMVEEVDTLAGLVAVVAVVESRPKATKIRVKTKKIPRRTRRLRQAVAMAAAVPPILLFVLILKFLLVL